MEDKGVTGKIFLNKELAVAREPLRRSAVERLFVWLARIRQVCALWISQ